MKLKRMIVQALALIGLASLVVGGLWLWRQRPWRTAVSVNGHVLTAQELDFRALTHLNDDRRVGRPVKNMESYRRLSAKKWIVKEVLLSEAIARGIEVGAEDEKKGLDDMARVLKSRKLTPEDFFKEGPIPEARKRQDFREGLLINKFTTKEVREKIKLTTKEIDEYQEALKAQATVEKKVKGKTDVKFDRKTAITQMHAERFQRGFRQLFRTLYKKADVRVPEFPDLERVDAVSPPRPEDKEMKK